MNNVKPGDLAKVVNDPYNAGRQVYVERQYTGSLFVARDGVSVLWRCISLQPIAYGKGMHQTKPGESIIIADAYLRRIDPPADTNEVFRDQPTELDRLIGLEVYFKERA